MSKSMFQSFAFIALVAGLTSACAMQTNNTVELGDVAAPRETVTPAIVCPPPLVPVLNQCIDPGGVCRVLGC
jgi:hypothetical protein